MITDIYNERSKPFDQGRAWVEIDLDALSYNARLINSHLDSGCELMAVVKADAYGHGAVQAAKRLQNEGVKSFAVATVSEGVQLRENGLDGDILVMNYTHPANALYLHNFRLKQLIVDGDYAKALNETGYKIDVHLSIDTGMHREGIDMSKLDEIESVFKHNNLNVEGMSTHFASSDSLNPNDIAFTEMQIQRFNTTVKTFRDKGYDVGKLHTQATYGLLNFNQSQCDYARIGIALYGVLSHDEITNTPLALRPVMSVKAIIAQIRWIDAGESVSYGRTYIADKPIRLATVCIGYADGVPRSMSGNNGECLLHGKRVPILGRICMDLLMIDVSTVDSAETGDVVTLIGSDGDEEIRCEDVASAAGTITNEVVCRMGSRLPRIYR